MRVLVGLLVVLGVLVFASSALADAPTCPPGQLGTPPNCHSPGVYYFGLLNPDVVPFTSNGDFPECLIPRRKCFELDGQIRGAARSVAVPESPLNVSLLVTLGGAAPRLAGAKAILLASVHAAVPVTARQEWGVKYKVPLTRKGQELFKHRKSVPATMTLVATDNSGYYKKLTKHFVLKIGPPL